MTYDVSSTSASTSGKGLSRPVILQAAIDSIDRSGFQNLTMRSLGRDLGVEAMALYRYVSGREDLLEAVVARLLDGLHQRIDSQEPESWQGYLQSFAHAVRKTAAAHPAAFPLIATRHPAAPWLLPPLRSLALVEHFLSTLSSFELTDHQVVAAYRSFNSFLLGNLLLEAAVRGADLAPDGAPLDEGEAEAPENDNKISLDEAPTISRCQQLLSEDHSNEEFEAALESLLDRMELALSQ